MFDESESLEMGALLETCNELYELAAGPMKPQSKIPTILTTLVDIQASLDDTPKNQALDLGSAAYSGIDSGATENDTPIVTKLFVEILEKCKFLLLFFF
jgi:hypothetical protein